MRKLSRSILKKLGIEIRRVDIRMPILVWPFDQAPEELKALSTHGGDEDWIALVPQGYANLYTPFLEEPVFGCYSVSEHKLKTGDVVKIGAHN